MKKEKRSDNVSGIAKSPSSTKLIPSNHGSITKHQHLLKGS